MNGRDVTPLGVGREVVDVTVPAGRQHHRVGRVPQRNLAGDQVADDDPRARPSTTTRSIISLRGYIVTRRAAPARARLIRPEQQLLARLPAAIEGPLHQHAAERPVRQFPAVLASKRHPLRHRLIDDRRAQFGEAVDVLLPRTKVSPLLRVGEQPPDRVAVVAIVLGRVDPSLRSDAVRRSGLS